MLPIHIFYVLSLQMWSTLKQKRQCGCVVQVTIANNTLTYHPWINRIGPELKDHIGPLWFHKLPRLERENMA